MAVRDDFTAGEVLAAADLNDTFASKVPYAYGTATPSTTVDGFVWFDENSTPPAPKFWDGAAFQGLGGGKVLQVVRATDVTDRSTSSTSFVDANLSVTITPQKSDSVILLMWSVAARHPSANFIRLQITDNSNNALSGAESMQIGSTTVFANPIVSAFVIGYSTPGTISATTYKARFCMVGGTGALLNSVNTGQLYAIEVAA